MAEEASASPLASVLDSPTSREEDREDSDSVSRGGEDPDVCPVARRFRAGLATPIPADTARRLARSSAALSASISWSNADLPAETADRMNEVAIEGLKGASSLDPPAREGSRLFVNEVNWSKAEAVEGPGSLPRVAP